MKQPYGEANEFNREFKSLTRKIKMSNEEQNNILNQINLMMDDEFPNRNNSFYRWKYIFAFAGAAVLVILLAVPMIMDLIQGKNGNFSAGKISSPEKTVAEYYEAYNNKDFEGFFNLASERARKDIEQHVYQSKEDWEAQWKWSVQPVKVIKIEEMAGGRKEAESFVTAETYYPVLGPEKSTKTTFRLVKENGRWKIDSDRYEQETPK